MEKVTPDANQVRSLLAAARLEKLNLEIEHLKNNGGRKKSLASYTPLLSVLIAVGGFLFGVYQFQRQQQIQQNQLVNEQQKERVTRDAEQSAKIQNQIRSDTDQILQFPKDQQQTISKVSFLLEDLRGYIMLASQRKTSSAQQDMRPVSIVLVRSVVNDCNFDQQRDIDYADILAGQWSDFGQYLQEEDTASLEAVLDKYTDALNVIYLRDRAIVRSVEFNEEQDFEFEKGYGKLGSAGTDHFMSVVAGFHTYLGFLKDEKTKAKHLLRLQAAMCNATLTKQIFGVKFSRNNDPENALTRCP